MIRRSRSPVNSQGGFTLVELVVSIVVLAIAVAGVLAALSAVSVRSANVLLSEQAAAIASAYLNEVQQKPFGTSDGQTARASLDVVDDYAGLNDVGVHDQTGAAVPGLSQFNVSVAVGPGTLPGVPAAQQRQIDVTVMTGGSVVALLSGFRTQHP
jgi:MSHA pilin protein MshD